jgi:hypothetical protein
VSGSRHLRLISKFASRALATAPTAPEVEFRNRATATANRLRDLADQFDQVAAADCGFCTREAFYATALVHRLTMAEGDGGLGLDRLMLTARAVDDLTALGSSPMDADATEGSDRP